MGLPLYDDNTDGLCDVNRKLWDPLGVAKEGVLLLVKYTHTHGERFSVRSSSSTSSMAECFRGSVPRSGA